MIKYGIKTYVTCGMKWIASNYMVRRIRDYPKNRIIKNLQNWRLWPKKYHYEPIQGAIMINKKLAIAHPDIINKLIVDKKPE